MRVGWVNPRGAGWQFPRHLTIPEIFWKPLLSAARPRPYARPTFYRRVANFSPFPCSRCPARALGLHPLPRQAAASHRRKTAHPTRLGALPRVFPARRNSRCHRRRADSQGGGKFRRKSRDDLAEPPDRHRPHRRSPARRTACHAHPQHPGRRTVDRSSAHRQTRGNDDQRPQSRHGHRRQPAGSRRPGGE